jgi:hypothetical protein
MQGALARRALLGGGLAVGLDTLAPQASAAAAMPWMQRFFHLYTGPDGLTRAEQIPVPKPTPAETQWLLRRRVERLTLGASGPNYRIDFHVAKQPTLLIPLFGTIIIELADGTRHAFGHGDFAYAEDCNGKGHISQAGPEGSFSVQVQLFKPLCLASGSTDFSRFWVEPD